MMSLKKKIQPDQYFDTENIEYEAFSFEKGELIAAPDRPTKWIHFITEGSVRIYGIRDDGMLIPIGITHFPGIIGDVELSTRGSSFFYAEAETKVITLSVPVIRYRDELNRDVKFLHALLNSYAEKIKMYSTLDLPAQKLEERVILYLRIPGTPNEIHGTEKAALSLHCSRRQLQRVLKKLCGEGKLVKTGRGEYKLPNA